MTFVRPLVLLALSTVAACTLATPLTGTSSDALGEAETSQTGSGLPVAGANSSPGPGASATLTPPPLTNPNEAADSPNKITVGQEPPGAATGASPNATLGGGNDATLVPPANGNVPAPASPNAPVAAPPATPAPAAYSPVPWPNLLFADYRGPLGNKVVALTFDDGPDGMGSGQNNTATILDILRANGLKATFFVCGNVWTQLATDKEAQADLRRIVAEGHDIGSHTFSHPHLDTISAADIAVQFATNENVVREVLGASFSFNKIRAPFGFPFQTNNPNVAWVAPAAAPFGVHIGWGIDTDDWKCAQNQQSVDCILNNLKAAIQAGHSGPILMHSVYKLTAQALPQIIETLKVSGYTFVTAEQMVLSKYGASSADIKETNARQSFTAAQISSAAISQCRSNERISVVY